MGKSTTSGKQWGAYQGLKVSINYGMRSMRAWPLMYESLYESQF